jgi:tetratricopeptide (TPR) repeat protein
LLAKFYRAIGNYYFHFRQNEPTATQLLDKALQLSRSCGAVEQETVVLNNIAMVKWQIGDYAGSQLHGNEAQRLSQLSSNLYEQATALWVECGRCNALGDYKNGISSCHKARKLLELSGMSGSHLDHIMINAIADIHLHKSEYAEALRINTQILEATSAVQSPAMFALGLINLAEINLLIGTHEQEVLQSLDQAKTLVLVPKEINICAMLIADLNLREGKTITAKTGFQKCLKSARQNDHTMILFGLERLANVSRWTPNDLPWTSRWTIIYLVRAQKAQNKLALHKALQFLGDVFIAQGDSNTAQTLFTVALEGFTFMDVHQSRAQCLLRLGDIANQRGLSSKAVELWTQARPLFERSLQKKEIANVDARLATVEPEVEDKDINTKLAVMEQEAL